MRRKNDKGFTLTEVLIAAAILTIAIVPMIANFVQSGKMNQKAKKTMNATYMAQDIMEGVTAYNAEELIKKFETGEDLIGTMLPNSITSYQKHGDADSSFTPQFSFKRSDASVSGTRQYATVVSGNSVKVNKSTDGNYYFFINEIESGKNKYNVRLTLSTSKYAKYAYSDARGGLKKLEDKTAGNNINSEEMPFILNVEMPFDASVKNTIQEVENIISDFQAHSSNPSKFAETTTVGGVSVPSWYNAVTRNTKITIKNDYTIELKNSYGIALAYQSAFGFDGSKIDVITANISEMGSSELPRSIYLFMEGMPGATISNEYDRIEIVNEIGKPIDVYVIRTVTASSLFSSADQMKTNDQIKGVLSTTSDTLYNTNYKSVISVTDAANLTRVTSNLKLDLNRLYDTTKKPESQEGFTDSRCSYIYNGSTLANTDADLKKMRNGFPVKQQDYIYTVLLQLYDAKTNKIMATIDGGLGY